MRRGSLTICVIVTLCNVVFATTGTWSTLNYPGSIRTEIYGIDGSNLVGDYWDTSYKNHGFLYNMTSETWTTIDKQGAYQIQVRDIDGSNLVGWYDDNPNKPKGFTDCIIMHRSNEYDQFKWKLKELHRLAVARLDIVEAQTACQYIIDNIDDFSNPLYYPHFVTVVICYTRPFTRNNIYGALSKKWSKFLNEPAAGMHKQLIDARHTFIAHSDGSVRDLQITPKGHVVSGTKYKIDDYSCQVKKFYIALENFPLAKANCQYLVARMNDEIKELLDYVGPQLDFSKGIVEIDITTL